MKDLVNHLELVQRVDFTNVGSYQLPGQAEYIDGVWWYRCSKEETRKLINEVFLPKSHSEWEEYLQNKEDSTGFDSVDAIHSVNRPKTTVILGE